jgi:hypothetical protein
MSAAGEVYALLIGINDYERDSVRNLQFAVADVLSFREMLRNRMDLKDDNCMVLGSPCMGAAPAPSRAEVLRGLAQFSNAPMKPEDSFVLYFAGHGFEIRGKSYLLTVDSDPSMPELLEETAVSLETLKNRFARNIRAGQQLWVLDACRNQPTTQSRDTGSTCLSAPMARDIVALAREGTTSPGAEVLRTLAILNACWEGQVSYEYPPGKHSWFCHNLLTCLQEHAPEELDVTELADWVGQRMVNNAWRDLPDAVRQMPYVVVEGRPVRLRMRPLPLPTLFSPESPEPAKVAIKEISVAPLEVQVEHIQTPQVSTPGLPPIPGDILELEGLLAGLEHTISALRDGSHSSLREGQAKLAEAQTQWEQMKAELETHELGLGQKQVGGERIPTNPT